MEFSSESTEDPDLIVASIGGIHAGLSATTLKSLTDLKDNHTKEIANIQDRYARLAEAGYHRVHSKASRQYCWASRARVVHLAKSF